MPQRGLLRHVSLVMAAKTIVAVILIVVGVVIVAYSGLTFTTPGESVQFLGLRIETREVHYIPPVMGVLALVIGLVLLLVKPRAA